MAKQIVITKIGETSDFRCNDSRKRIVIIAGPGGIGKNAMVNALLKCNPQTFEKIVSYTSRDRRPGEKNGVDYNYISKDKFEDLIKNKEVFEFTEIYGYYRGMCKPAIDKILAKGKIAIKDTDLIGVQALRRAYPNKVLSIFLTTSRTEIAKRLLSRGDREEDRMRRLADYDTQMKIKHHFDYIVDNTTSLDETVQKVHDILIKEGICQKNS